MDNVFSFESIKKFLNFSDEFWSFVGDRIKYVDGTISENKIFYCTLMKFNDCNELIDIKVIVPYIINLETALVNIHEFKHAYDLYFMMGKVIDNESFYEEQAILEEKRFMKSFIK